MMAKIQRFGGAMFTPVLFFVFSGLIVSIFGALNNPALVGGIANEGTTYHKIISIIEAGGWTVFNNMPILFAIGLPLGLVDKAKGRAVLEAFVLYMTFQSFLAAILSNFGDAFGVDYSIDPEVAGSGLTFIGGIKTLDTGVLGAIIVSSIIVWVHNKYFEKKLPDWLGIFQGSSLVGAVGFIILIPVAILFAWVWPILQHGVYHFSGFLAKSGSLGVFLYIFLEKALLPTGLHHFIYAPFQFGPAVVDGGTTLYWFEHLKEFAASTENLKQLFPAGGFALQGLSNYFGIPGIALAFYATTKKENRKKLLALIVPGLLTSIFAGITEPFDYTFLFIAPALFFVHAGLAATFASISYAVGTVGNFGGGLIEAATSTFIPLWTNHSSTFINMFLVGAVSIVVYFIVFTFLIKKFDLKTPGRGGEEVQLFTKSDYKNKKESKEINQNSGFKYQAAGFLKAFGGKNNVKTVNNCATRLRIQVVDVNKVSQDTEFLKYGAHGVVKHGDAYQIIVGLDVPQVREAFDSLIEDGISSDFDEFEKVILSVPISGEVISLNKVPDEVFSKGMVGSGFAVLPKGDKLYSPVKGIVESIFPTYHALTLKDENGVSVLIHIGLDTVELKGSFINLNIKEGEEVNTETVLATIDQQNIIDNGKSTEVIIVCPEFHGAVKILSENKVEIEK